MRFLVDTHLLVWASSEPKRLSRDARHVLEDGSNELAFSAMGMWELAIKKALGKPGFTVDARLLRRELIDRGWAELGMTSEHGFIAGDLPPLHRDPFDRAMIAQAMAEGMVFLTADAPLAGYKEPVRLV